MRTPILICCLFQETNSFSPVRTDVGALQAGGLVPADRVAAKFRNTDSEVSGFLDVLEARSLPLDFLPSVWLMPAGPLTPEALALYEDALATALRRASPSGVLAAVHGCLASEDEPDVTGRILGQLRAAAGQTPLVSSADFHANLTDRMLGHADMLVGYRTYPHADLRQTGQRAAEALLRLLDAVERPAPVCRRLPLIVPPEASEHNASPMCEVWHALAEAEQLTGWPASCFCAHPWLDAPGCSSAFLAYANAEQCDAVRPCLSEAAVHLWDARATLYRPMRGLEAAWDAVEARAERPVILVDSGDIVLAGAPGDSTAVLRLLSSRDTRLRCLLHVSDPGAAGVLREGEACAVSVGAAWARSFYGPVAIRGRVVRVCSTPYVLSGPYLRDVQVDPGRRAVIEWRGHTLVVAEKPDPAHDPAFFRSLGIEPRAYDVIVVKSHNTFRPAYADISTAVVRAATPGTTTPNLHSLPYTQGPQHLYPLAEPDHDPDRKSPRP